jgi:hypothetical protein
MSSHILPQLISYIRFRGYQVFCHPWLPVLPWHLAWLTIFPYPPWLPCFTLSSVTTRAWLKIPNPKVITMVTTTIIC